MRSLFTWGYLTQSARRLYQVLFKRRKPLRVGDQAPDGMMMPLPRAQNDLPTNATANGTIHLSQLLVGCGKRPIVLNFGEIAVESSSCYLPCSVL
jgi:hypothetical protein